MICKQLQMIIFEEYFLILLLFDFFTSFALNILSYIYITISLTKISWTILAKEPSAFVYTQIPQ